MTTLKSIKQINSICPSTNDRSQFTSKIFPKKLQLANSNNSIFKLQTYPQRGSGKAYRCGPQQLNLKAKSNRYEEKKQQLLKKYPQQKAKVLPESGIKQGCMIGDYVLMKFQKKFEENENYKFTHEQSVKNHQMLAGKELQNLNTVVEANNDYIVLKSYGSNYHQSTLMSKQRQVDGLERVYHIRDGLKGLKQLRQNGRKYHNDIKPNNVAVKKDGTFILADFDTASNNVRLIETNQGAKPINDVQNILECITCDINIQQSKMPLDNGYTDMINGFLKNQKVCTQNQDKLSQTIEIMKSLIQKENQEINKEASHTSNEPLKVDNGVQRVGVCIQKVEKQVILSNYHKQVNQQLIFLGVSTAVNAISSYCKTSNRLNKNQVKNQSISKECKIAALKQLAKGGIGIAGKLIEKNHTQNQIIKNFQNRKYRIGRTQKNAINLGVEIGKEIVDFAISKKKVNIENLKESGKKVMINSVQFSATQYLTSELSKKIGIEAAETFANYSANTVASTVGKNTVKTVLIQAAEETGKNLFTNTFTSSLKGNAIGMGVGFAVGTIADVCRGKQIVNALKDNAKQTVTSAVGTAIGAVIGSVFPVMGTAVGGFIGGLAGSFFSAWL